MFYLSHCASTSIHTNLPYAQSRLPVNHKKKGKTPSLAHKASHRGIGHKCPCKPKKTKENISPANFTPEKKTEGSTGRFEEVGLASWYGRDFDGKPTASGEIFDSRKLTAAHKTIPLGSIILVRNMENEKEVFLKVNDRGPFVEGRILDVSEYGAEVLGYKEDGLSHVGIRMIRRGSNKKGKLLKGRGATYEFFKNGQDAGKSDTSKPIPNSNDGSSLTRGLEIADQSQDYYSVQVGAFSDLGHARKLGQRLEEYEQPIQLRRKGAKYIVRAGNFKNRQEAEELKLLLKGDGFSAFIAEPQE